MLQNMTQKYIIGIMVNMSKSQNWRKSDIHMLIYKYLQSILYKTLPATFRIEDSSQRDYASKPNGILTFVKIVNNKVKGQTAM